MNAFSSLHRLLARLCHDRRGNVMMVFALSLLPIIGIVGFSIDYFTGLSYKARLDAAADSAAIAAITAAQTYYNNNAQTDPQVRVNAKAAGDAQGNKVFLVNAANSINAVTTSPPYVNTTVPATSQTITATATYSGKMNTAFGKIFSVPQFTIAGQATSSLTMGTYLDFYLLLDVSGSMGIPTSNSGQTALAAINPDNRSLYPTGCVFACHFAGNQGYTLAESNGIKLRIDSVGSAVNSMIATAQQTQTLKNQFRIGLFPFIADAIQAAPLSSNFTQATTVANNLGANYLDNGIWYNQSDTDGTGIGSGGTHFENIFNDLFKHASAYGTGATPLAPKPFVFLVTDGADNNQTYYYGSWTGSQPQEPTSITATCQFLQTLGVTVSILYIPYVPIQNPNPSFAGDEDDRVNAIIPNLPGDLKACASPGFFFTANSDADITAAMQAMFAQALQAARLTQ